MIENIKLALTITEIEDIHTFNLMIMKGVFKIPRTREDFKNNYRIKKQLKQMTHGE